MDLKEIEKLLEARVKYLASHPSEAKGEEILQLIECARNTKDTETVNGLC